MSIDDLEKAKRITRVKNSIDSDEEVRRRLPEVDAIYDEDVRRATIQYFRKCCPDYFWERPASASGKYHPPDERSSHGTWLHTKRVFNTYANLSESYVEMRRITDHERACGKAAALIHDTFNYGWPSSGRDMTTSKHDVIASAVAAFVAPDMPEEVIHLVNSHMGPWGEGKTPQCEHERLFHTADMSAAQSSHKPDVYFPSEELQDEFPELESIDVSEEEFV
ncbi:MAG: hypothetical protein J07AB43_00710 [Candidatus Nanosalina sp. J07AB43]|jgi:HD domain.|nr:MAG: hypothetical protein J07AB43_00710 [Candidatus Nanosalina sp. J07AB43]